MSKQRVPRGRLRRLAWRVVRLLFGLLVLLLVLVTAQGWTAFGKRATGARLLRMLHSPNYRDGKFVNPQPLVNDYWGMLGALLHASDHVNPHEPVAAARLSGQDLIKPPPSGRRREMGVRAAAGGLVLPCAPNGAASHQTF